MILHKQKGVRCHGDESVYRYRAAGNCIETGGLKTKRDTVNLALKEFIQRRKNADILALFGTIDYDADYDYKEARNRTEITRTCIVL